MFKKSLLLSTLFVFSGLVNAQSVSISYQDQQNTATHTQGHILNTKISQNLSKELSLDFTNNDFRNDGSSAIFDRYELGATYMYRVNNIVSAGARASLGHIYTSNKGDWATYTAEPTVKFNLGKEADITLGYRRRAGFHESNLDTSNTWSGGLGFNLTKKDKVSFGYAKLSGNNGGTANNPNKTYALTYTRGF